MFDQPREVTQLSTIKIGSCQIPGRKDYKVEFQQALLVTGPHFRALQLLLAEQTSPHLAALQSNLAKRSMFSIPGALPALAVDEGSLIGLMLG